MKGRFAAILLITILTVPLLSTYMWLQHKKYTIRKEVKQKIISGIEKEELELLKFTKEETQEKLDWKHDYEFEYRGEMYDIVERKQVGDSVYYWCWWDHEETQLNKKLTSLMNIVLGGHKDAQEKQKHLTHYLNSLFYDAPFTWNPNPSFTIKKSFTTYYNHYSFLPFPPESPPPWTDFYPFFSPSK